MTSKYIPLRVPIQARKREKKNDYSKITEESIKEALAAVFNDDGSYKDKEAEYYRPKEVSPGLWQIGPLLTGNGGKKLYNEVLQKQIEEESKKLWKESSGWKK